MEDRGYPTQPYDQTLADLSVEHASTLDHFRAAHDISTKAAAGTASTEDLRQAMIHYRALFAELLGDPASNLDGRAGQDGVPATEAGPETAGDQPAPSSIDQSAATPVDEPAATAVDEPAAAPVNEPAATAVDDPAVTRVDEPAATRVDEPAATPADEPAAASADQPADPALNRTPDAVPSARRQER
jgi:hypothetical protein